MIAYPQPEMLVAYPEAFDLSPLPQEPPGVPVDPSAPLTIEDAMWITAFPAMPHVVRHVGTKDRTYIPFIKRSGMVCVAAYDHDEHTLRVAEIAQEQGDDHNIPAVLVLADGRIGLFWSEHLSGDRNHIRYCFTESGDTFTWGPVRQLAYGTRINYAQVFQVQSGEHAGRIGVFSRYGSAETWVLAWSDDLGDSWTNRTWIAAEVNRLYQTLTPVHGEPDQYWIGLQTHPLYDNDQSIRLVRFDAATGEVTHPLTSVSLGNIYANTGLTVDWEEGQTVYAAQVGDRSRLSDVNPWGDVLFGVWQSGTQCVLSHARRQGNGSYLTTEIGSAGRFIDHSGGGGSTTNGYHGEASLSRENRDRFWFSQEAGGLWTVNRYDHDSTAWASVPASANTTPAKRFRPKAVVNAHPSVPVLWIESEYNTYDDWSNASARAREVPDGAVHVTATGTSQSDGSAVPLREIAVTVSGTAESDGEATISQEQSAYRALPRGVLLTSHAAEKIYAGETFEVRYMPLGPDGTPSGVLDAQAVVFRFQIGSGTVVVRSLATGDAFAVSGQYRAQFTPTESGSLSYRAEVTRHGLTDVVQGSRFVELARPGA